MNMLLTEEEKEKIVEIYYELYGNDLKIDFEEEDIVIDRDGDIRRIGVVKGHTLGEVEELAKQVIMMLIMGKYEGVGGIRVSLEELIGELMINSEEMEEKINIIKAIMISKITNSDLVTAVNRFDGLFDETNGRLIFNIEIETITGEIVETNFNVSY